VQNFIKLSAAIYELLNTAEKTIGLLSSQS